MSAHDAAERFARGTGRRIPRGAALPRTEEEVPPAPRRIAPEEEEENEPMLYPVERTGQGCAGFTLQALFYLVLLGVLAGFLFFGVRSIGLLNAGEISSAPQPTANIDARPTSAPRPTPPNNPPAASGGDEAPPAYEDAIATYNEQQQATAQAWEATQEAPGATGGEEADNEAAIEAWLQGEPSTPTMTPGIEEAAMDVAAVVVDAAFDATFEDAPACSQFVGYLPGSECHAFFLAQTATAGEE